MLHRNSFQVLLCFLALGLFCTVGCGPTTTTETPVENADHGHDDHDHDEHAGHDHDFHNLGEAVAEIDELTTEITTAYTDGEPDSAHDALHHIADVLEATINVIDQSSLDADSKASASQAVEDLFDAFTAIDEKMHGEEGKEFDEVKPSIESAIETLKALAKK